MDLCGLALLVYNRLHDLLSSGSQVRILPGAPTKKRAGSALVFERAEAARHRLSDAEQAARELQRLSDAQSRRDAWLEAHPEEVCWSRELT